jgi:hypothetical protein
MRDHKDHITEEIPGLKPPRKPRASKYASAAEKQAAYRARKGVIVRAIQLPEEVDAALRAYMAKKGTGISDTIVALLRTQLLRKR